MRRTLISLIGLVVFLVGCEGIPGSNKQGPSATKDSGTAFVPPEPSKAIAVLSATAKGSMGYEGKKAHLSIKNNTPKDIVMIEFTIQYFDADSKVMQGSPMHYVQTAIPAFLKASETKEFDIEKKLPAKASRLEVTIDKIGYAE